MNDKHLQTILIVDDVSDNIQVVAHHLRGKGYELLFATDGLSALETLAQGPVDLVLLDVMMPQMDGFETCRRMKADPKTRDIPVIFLTAKTDSTSVMEGFEAGGVDYVAKPFFAGELLARVSTHLTLRQREQQLRMLMAARDRFLSIITNQLETPFNGLRGILRMLVRDLRELPPDELAEFISMADSAADSMSDLLTNLASWARMNNNEFGLQPTRVNPADVLREVVDLHSINAVGKDVSFDLKLDNAQEIDADPEILELVFENLVSNAIKYTSPGSQIIVEIQPGEEQTAVLIQDAGEGLQPEQIDAIFSLDDRVLQSGTSGEEGSGIGLFLCRELLTRSGATLALQNRSGEKGLEARVELPIKAAAA
jgi:signal transduction histidine kinase